ncbi:hypothetical protein GCM10010517_15500 [Streptosporangium fragile]|uniref:Uncharacterized protein n=1 Tax=Streptosporangium fragile TaxID=46186 RepID=A0ABN3VTW6_9ACTN
MAAAGSYLQARRYCSAKRLQRGERLDEIVGEAGRGSMAAATGLSPPQGAGTGVAGHHDTDAPAAAPRAGAPGRLSSVRTTSRPVTTARALTMVFTG